MLYRSLFSTILSSVFFLSASDAAVFERDWQSPGDGLLTYDDVNQWEWIDLTETLLSDFPGDDLESRFQSVVAETGPGGMFEGFLVPSSDSVVIALAESAGIDATTIFPVEAKMQATIELVALFGKTTTPTDGEGVITIGMIDDFLSGPNFPTDRAFGSLFNLPNIVFLSAREVGASGLLFGTESSRGMFVEAPGVFLFRIVPEPSAVTAALIGAFMFSFFAKRHVEERYSG